MTELRTGPQTENEPPANLDLSERGRTADGQAISLNRRLFMQFLAFTDCRHKPEVAELISSLGLNAVIYDDLNDPLGIGLLTFHERPEYFLDAVRPAFQQADLRALRPRPEMSMLGRTYTLGYEPDLAEALLHRPVERVCNPQAPWAIWYPVRRKGSFVQLSREEQRKILMEHGGIGHAYGRAGVATDVRLACHGLGVQDNDFIVGLLGKELFPLSALVEHMRQTRQTSEYIDHMGPFFIGRAMWQAPVPAGENGS